MTVIIQHKKTKQQWVAISNKSSWAKPAHAKAAFKRGCKLGDAFFKGEEDYNGRPVDVKSRKAKKGEYGEDDDWVRPFFDEQDVWEIVTVASLSVISTEHVKELELARSDLHAAKALLGMISISNSATDEYGDPWHTTIDKFLEGGSNGD